MGRTSKRSMNSRLRATDHATLPRVDAVFRLMRTSHRGSGGRGRSCDLCRSIFTLSPWARLASGTCSSQGSRKRVGAALQMIVASRGERDHRAAGRPGARRTVVGCGCMPHCRKKNVEVARARHTAKARAGTRDSPNSWRLEALIYLWLHAKHQGWSRTGARRRLAVTRFCERYWSTACHGNELFTWAARQIAGIVRARVQPERMQTRKRGLTRVAFGSLGPLRTGRSRRSRVPFCALGPR